MKLNKLAANRGIKWIIDGISIFSQAPAIIILLSASIQFTTIFAEKLFILGILIKIISSHIVFFIAMSLGKTVLYNDRNIFMRDIFNIQTIKKGFIIGCLVFLICVLTSLLSLLPFMREIHLLLKNIDSFGISQESIFNLEKLLQIPTIITGISILIFNVLLIFCMPIAIWNQTKLLKSLFFSSLSVLYNAKPLTIYLTTWIAIFFLTEILINYAFKHLLSETDLLILGLIIKTVSNSVFYASLYPMYLDFFKK
ncbi:hypothetical protein [Candidatus Kinetoplastidibacterium crithidiae]|uniref:Uncharacterized protein n=1 Tax=Candidatus Kinetoplastidibacterium crithidiae TCC036E TaxID=1208918 RepID=M1LTS3_9PROT|nr:hypothetical protein [Candidatus Kinetoplastibacterium crithidii]AFZ82841.1 hypothetical protein CKCE_0411 [Candidatus Kinetoplastibacterium crithidii (ex Angomonas deanei ATCC 30255)]AGF47506.1 hypothetical protein CDEE_0459 [Candidatus Kinetoplastibacterium crithidii TCC036E]